MPFSTIMRTPRASFGTVEPHYYTKYGPQIFAISELIDKEDYIGLTEEDILKKEALLKSVPQIYLQDWLQRRETNLNINHQLTKLARGGHFSFLAIGKDDNAPLSHTHMEARKLGKYTYDLTQKNFQIISGVDQLGLLLLTRAINDLERYRPKIYVKYAPGTGALTLPQYSDLMLIDSVPQQIIAANGNPVSNIYDADLVLAINTPFDGIVLDSTDPSNQFFSSIPNKTFSKELESILDKKYKVSFADIAYSNGGDNGLLDLLSKSGQLEKLTAYNGWNTADNAIGFAIGQGLLMRKINPNASQKLMKTRFIDDWFYQSNARKTVTNYLIQKDQRNLIYDLCNSEQYVNYLAQEACKDLARKYAYTANNTFYIEFPWHRLFEITVNLKN